MKNTIRLIIISIVLFFLIFFLVILGIALNYSLEKGRLECSGFSGNPFQCGFWEFIWNIISTGLFLILLYGLFTGGMAIVIPVGVIFLILYWLNRYRAKSENANEKANKSRKK